MRRYKTIFGYVLVPEQEWRNYSECVRQCDIYKAQCSGFQEQRDALLDLVTHIASESCDALNRLGVDVSSQK